jgi:hypothetical protein
MFAGDSSLGADSMLMMDIMMVSTCTKLSPKFTLIAGLQQ